MVEAMYKSLIAEATDSPINTATLDDTAPDGAAPSGTASDCTTPDSTALYSTATDGTSPDGPAPDSTAPDEIASVCTIPDGGVSDDPASDGMAPDRRAADRKKKVMIHDPSEFLTQSFIERIGDQAEVRTSVLPGTMAQKQERTREYSLIIEADSTGFYSEFCLSPVVTVISFDGRDDDVLFKAILQNQAHILGVLRKRMVDFFLSQRK